MAFSIDFLGQKLEAPFRFSSNLKFSPDDIRSMEWLKEKDRYYNVETELGKGGRAIALKGWVSSEDGTRRPASPAIVLKIPNVNNTNYRSDQIREYLNRLAEECRDELRLTRSRLKGCEYANPIFDFSIVEEFEYVQTPMQVPVTAQIFLHDARPLDKYLLDEGQRTRPYESERGLEVNKWVDNWNGMPDPTKWVALAKGIARGLADIHRRRVVHGDIWPPNVFIRVNDDNTPIPVFIDFGEAFAIEPMGKERYQKDSAYRAPERRDGQSIVTQQADVYSFGKLLLHLAIGEEPILKPSDHGHKRRDLIRQKFKERNEGIMGRNPFIVDIICKCISVDPVDRPSMDEVYRALDTYVDVRSYSIQRPDVAKKIDSVKQSWKEVSKQVRSRGTKVAPFLEEIIEQRLDEIQWMISGLSEDVINLNDTRERLIRAMVGLFHRMEKDDSFLSITTPRMWQGSALGLDGRYLTANALAAARGASIQRTFIFSIEEVGSEWATQLSRNLNDLYDNKKIHQPNAGKLAELLIRETDHYLASRVGKEKEHPNHRHLEAQHRLSLVIKSYLDSEECICRGALKRNEEFKKSSECTGIYIGVYPVSTLKELRTLKAAHPISVFTYNSAKDKEDKYLLMMTDCLGRSSFTSDNNRPDVVLTELEKPQLRGITVFKSALGTPEDRIMKIEEVFRQSISVGYWLNDFYGCLPK